MMNNDLRSRASFLAILVALVLMACSDDSSGQGPGADTDNDADAVSDSGDGGSDLDDGGSDLAPDGDDDAADAGEDLTADLGEDALDTGDDAAADTGDDATADAGDDASDLEDTGDDALADADDAGDDASDAGDTGDLADADADLTDADADLTDADADLTDADADLADAGDVTSEPDALPDEWIIPPCTEVTGTAAVTFTDDNGATLADVDGALTGISYTWGVVALPEPNLLYAVNDTSVLRSVDAGCTWTEHDTISGLPVQVRLAAGSGGVAFAWSDNDQFLYRINDSGATRVISPAENMTGLAVDPEDATHLFGAGKNGQIVESLNGGSSWDRVGEVPVLDAYGYRMTFDRTDFDHAIFGDISDGAWVTFDGGSTWDQATGFSDDGEGGEGRSNVFEIVFYPGDSDIVWAAAVDIEETLPPLNEDGHHLYRSADGGATWDRVLDRGGLIEGTETLITWTNQPIMAADPMDPNILYFIFGTYFQGYGTDVFRYDASDRSITATHNDYNDFGAIEFSPADPKYMYFGIIHDAHG